MKRILAAFLWLAAVTVAVFAQTQPRVPAATNGSPAERAIADARQAIEKSPKQAGPYNALALALSRRARETSDVRYYSQAEEVLKKSLEVAPGNFEAEKTRVWLLLGKHEFAQALEAAKALNTRVPDDVMVYGFLTDANAELGNYEEAEKATNWMLKLRPGNIPGLTRAAYLRELFGDLEGALELMHMAYQSTPPSQSEDGAWILTQMAHLQLLAGHTKDAENLLNEALQKFANYHYALANLAKVRISQHRYSDAVELLRQRFNAAPHAENLFDLAEALALAGREEEAQASFMKFEQLSLAESNKADNSNRELILYYIDRAKRPADALRIAEKEFQRRKDVYTLDSYAWALFANGRLAEARQQIETAMRVGVRDPKLLEHDRQIHQAPTKASGGAKLMIVQRVVALFVFLLSVAGDSKRQFSIGNKARCWHGSD
jgi:tetratricopeptide (TPR) repeat protein